METLIFYETLYQTKREYFMRLKSLKDLYREVVRLHKVFAELKGPSEGASEWHRWWFLHLCWTDDSGAYILDWHASDPDDAMGLLLVEISLVGDLSGPWMIRQGLGGQQDLNLGSQAVSFWHMFP